MKKAIVVSINDKFAFAFACFLMGLKRHYSGLFVDCDVICYEDEVTDKNKKILKSIAPNVQYRPITDLLKVIPDQILKDVRVQKHRWGCYVLIKLLGFELIKEYEKVLFLDVDMLIQEDISEIFSYQYLGWRRNLGSWCQKAFKYKFLNKDKIIGCGGGTVLFQRN